MEATTTTHRAEDGTVFVEGDRMFNYYDRKLGTVGPIESDGWFDFTQDDGTRAFLNGERICSVQFAQRKGWTS